MKYAPLMAIVVALAACAPTSKPAPPIAASATYGPAASIVASKALEVPPPTPRAAADQCGLDEVRGVVGRSRLEIPIPLEPGRRRVLCDTCPRSDDHVPGRQTVLFDARTGLVTAVACG